MPPILARLRRTVAARRLLFDARARSEWWTRTVAADAVHQDATLTWTDRYPRLFAAAQRALGRDGALRLLSFGCSSGEEVVTLRRYFPRARIVGAEINRAQLAACRRLPPDERVTFLRSTQPGIAALGPYDAVFCMAVLQRRAHWVERERMSDVSGVYPFARFEAEVAFLVSQLRAGGLLVVDHCQYRVEDTGAAALLESVGGETVYPARGPRFDRAGRLIAPQPVVARLFRRTAA